MSDHPAGKLILFNDAALRAKEALNGDGFGLEDRLSPIYRAILSKETHTPFSVMFSGDWGTGKTSAMRWMDDYLDKHGRGGGESLRIHTCWFYPWKYQDREDVWKGLIAEVILATMDFEKVDPNMVLKAVSQFGKFLGGAFVRLVGSIKFSSGTDAAKVEYELKEALSGLVEEYSKHVTPQKAYFNAFEESLKGWVQACYKKDHSRLVLFIDDLDRCLPAIALQVLESIKLYLNIPEVVVVVGVDRRVIDATVVQHYKTALGDDTEIVRKARHYLDKMFQVEVPIAPPDHGVRAYIKGQLSSMVLWQKLKDEHRQMFEDAIGQIADINPRSVVRALNTAIVGAGAGKDPVEIAQSIQRAFIMAVLQRQEDTNLHDLCLRREGRRFFNEWTKAVIANPSKRRILVLSAVSDGTARTVEASEVNPEQNQSLRKGGAWARQPSVTADVDDDHLQEVARRFPHYRDVMQISMLRNLLGLEFPLEDAENLEAAKSESDSWSNLQRIIAESKGIADSEVTQDLITNLTTINFKGTTITDEEMAHLERLTSLRSLNLTRTEITDAGLSYIQKLPSLRQLYLEQSRVTDEGLVHIKGLTSLTTLDLDQTEVTDAGLIHLKELSSLDCLYLKGTKVTDAGISYLSGLASLRTLTLDSTGITDEGLVHLKELRELDYLDLDNTEVSDMGLVHLKELRSLKCLFLTGAPITDVGLFHLNGLTSLEVLNLSGPGITDEGLVHLEELTSLTQLSLYASQVTDDGLVHLKQLTSLESLYLGATKVTDAGLVHLKELTSLTTLSLYGTEVTDAGLIHFSGLKSLRSLELGGTKVTSKGLVQLRMALPNLQSSTPF